MAYIKNITTDTENTSNEFFCGVNLGFSKSVNDTIYLELGKAPIALFEEFKNGNLYLSLDTKVIGTKEEIYASYRNANIVVGTETEEPAHPCDIFTIEEMFADNAEQPYVGLQIYTYEEFCECCTQSFICEELFKDQGYVVYGLIS